MQLDYRSSTMSDRVEDECAVDDRALLDEWLTRSATAVAERQERQREKRRRK